MRSFFVAAGDLLQTEPFEDEGARALIGEIERAFPVLHVHGRIEVGQFFAGREADLCKRFSRGSFGNDEFPVRVALNGHHDLIGAVELKVFEPRRAPVPEVGYVLCGGVVPVLARLREVRVAQFQEFEDAVPPRAAAGIEVAGDARLIGADAAKRPSVQPAGGQFRLQKFPARIAYFLRAGLAGKLVAVGLAVIEYVIFIPYLNETAVGIAQIVERLGVAVESDVADGDESTAVAEPLGGFVADGIAQLVPLDGRIDEVISPVELAHGGRFEELVSLESRPRAVFDGGADVFDLAVDGEHIGPQFHDHGALFGGGMPL